jgi:hypothetical protein
MGLSGCVLERLAAHFCRSLGRAPCLKCGIGHSYAVFACRRVIVMGFYRGQRYVLALSSAVQMS